VQALTEDELMQVLMQPRNALGRQFVYQFELSGTRLHVADDAQRAIASMVRASSAQFLNGVGMCLHGFQTIALRAVLHSSCMAKLKWHAAYHDADPDC
jgi:ATP-dependent protease HslVU (ClpYQ) ATPase subunit